MNRILYAIFICSVALSCVTAQEKPIAQDSVTYKLNFKPPGVYAGITFGGFELFSLTFGTKISERITSNIKCSALEFSNTFGSSLAVSVGANYYFNPLGIFRYASFNTGFLFGSSYKRGYMLQWLLGNCTDFEDGFGFIYEVGAMYHPTIGAKFYYDTTERAFLEPVAKIGWIYNF